MIRLVLGLLLALGPLLPVHGAEVTVAVAANFIGPMQKIAAEFEKDTGHRAVLVSGSTGVFYQQITRGAPFDLLLAADEATPARLQAEGLALAATRFTYAVGKLVLWSRTPGLVDANGDVLKTGAFERIAAANPALAPYGAAALQTLTKLGLLERLRARLVQGENISQTYQFVATGSAALGFVALSQVFADGRITQGSAWIVPENLHEPIQQDAVILQRAASNAAAQSLAGYLRAPKAQAIVRSHGYGLPKN